MVAPQHSFVPVPDPTALTVDMLRRELGGLRELLSTRIDSVEKASETFQTNLMRVPTEVEKQVAHLRALTDQKFATVDSTFAERRDSVIAALTAMKDAVAAQNTSNVAAVTKSEAAVTKQIDTIYGQLAETKNVMNDKIEAINSRLNRGEGAQTGRAADTARNIAIGALIIAAFGIGMAYLNSQRVATAPQGFSAPAVTVEPKKTTP